MLHENIKKFMEGFRYDAHPMGMFLSTVGALSTFYPDAKRHLRSSSRASCRSHRPDREGADASPPTPTATASAGRTCYPTTT